MVIHVPLVFSVVLLVVELFLPHKQCGESDADKNEEKQALTQNSFAVTMARETIKVAFYNVATMILLLVFSKK